METKRIYPDTEAKKEQVLNEAAELIRRGEVVAFPTETVYGLGGDALNSSACAKIFEIKGRPADNPLIVHVASVQEAKKLVKNWPWEAEVCARQFWPGPLTLVLPKVDIVPDITSGGLDTVAIRMPSHPLALELIARAGCPIAAPSANISGKPSPTEGEHVWQDFCGKIPLLIDAGKCKVGLESTVLDLSGKIPLILRPGGITWEQLNAVLGKVELDPAVEGNLPVSGSFKPKAPGMKYRHYAPQGEIVLVSGDKEQRIAQIAARLNSKKAGERIALLCFEETIAALKEATPNGDQSLISKADLMFPLGSRNNQAQAASRLFKALRLCDQQKISLILAEVMEEKGIGRAFMNRLKKAAGYKKDKL
ncbi:MAG: threonylcarbamoyl-AMP synthase [Peptococcaceae bacterium]|nr:threonylcarbamoyl-AMP synthase [Peptococcaceae bacterium]